MFEFWVPPNDLTPLKISSFQCQSLKLIIQIVLSSNCWWNIASLAQLCSTSIWSIVKSQQFTDLTTNNRSKWLNNCFVPLTTISLSKAFRILTIRLCKAAQDHDVTCIPWMRVSVGFVASSIIRLLPHGQQLCTKCIFTKEFVYCYCEECISSKWTSLAAIITL